MEDVVEGVVFRTEAVISFLTAYPITIDHRSEASRNSGGSNTARMATITLKLRLNIRYVCNP